MERRDETLRLGDLKPDARRHTPRNVEAIEQALPRGGSARSIVVYEDGPSRAGNATIEAAAQAGIAIPTQFPLPEGQKRPTVARSVPGRTVPEAPMRTVAGPPKYVDTAMKPTVSIGGRIYHVDARTAAMLERIAGRAEKIGSIQIGEIHVKFHHDRVRSLLITESDDPRA